RARPRLPLGPLHRGQHLPTHRPNRAGPQPARTAPSRSPSTRPNTPSATAEPTEPDSLNAPPTRPNTPRPPPNRPSRFGGRARTGSRGGAPGGVAGAEPLGGGTGRGGGGENTPRSGHR